MSPLMAAMMPIGCVEVAQSECDAPAATGGTTSPVSSGAPMLPSTSWMDGPTEITLDTYEPTELKPYTEGVEVIVSVYSVRQFDPSTGAVFPTEVARGKTDAQGRYVFQGQAPSPNTDYRYRVEIPEAKIKQLDVQARTADAAAAGNGQLSKSRIMTVVCPPNIDSLVCAVAQAQIEFQSIYDQQLIAWHYASAGQGQARIASFAADMAHSNTPLNHPKLSQHAGVFSWWVGDRGIPPKDWPDLVRNYEQAWTIFMAIPFPQWTGIKNYFRNCASGLTIGQGRNAELYSVISARLYSKTWSDYFPRTDKQIEMDMAVSYSTGLQAIWACMVWKIEQQIKRTKRTIKNMVMMSLALVLLNLPFLMGIGIAGFAAIASETYDAVRMLSGMSTLGTGVTAALAIGTIGAGDPALLISTLEPIINGLLVDLDPTTAAAIKLVYPQVVRVAMGAIPGIASNSVNAGSNLIVSGASGFSTLAAGAFGAIVVMAIKALTSIPKMHAAQRMEELGDAIAGIQEAKQDMLALKNHEEVSPEFKPFLIWVFEATGMEDLINQVIDDFLNQAQQALDAGAQQGGGIAVVPEADGGGVAIVPTDSAGTPTDVHGVPLPDGEAPLSPPSGGSTIPGVPSPPMPLTSGVGTVGSVAGIGGATLALLLVTGAVSL